MQEAKPEDEVVVKGVEMALSPKDEQREAPATKPKPKPKPMTMVRAAHEIPHCRPGRRPDPFSKTRYVPPRPQRTRPGPEALRWGMGPAPLQRRQASRTCTATASQRL